METSKLNFLYRVIDELLIYNIDGDVAKFIACQFALESNFGLSDLAIRCHNYCGMKLPVVRRSTASNFGDHDKWAIYDSFSLCVADYVLCLTYRWPMSCVFNSVSEFKHFIKGWYCPEKSYLDRINSIYVQFQNQLKNGN